jgi:hypothetical protein
MKPTADTLPCGHPAAAVSTADEGTSCCLWCAEVQAAESKGEKNEREACAAVVERLLGGDPAGDQYLSIALARIRARGNR